MTSVTLDPDMKTQHSPTRRAEATADPRRISGQQLDLSACVAPRNSGGVWTPVRGPHLKVIRKQYCRNRTGLPGISFGTISARRKDGTLRLRTYFFVNLGKTSRKFCIESLGRHEAWHRALSLRAQHELRIQQINTQIINARNQHHA